MKEAFLGTREKSSRRILTEIGRRVYERGYVAANDGNISMRIGCDRILVTPTGMSKGFMNPEQMVPVDMNGRVLKGDFRPSSEIRVHLAVYRHRPDIHGICHAHPVHATAFAVAGIPLNRPVLPEVVIGLGCIPVIPYGTPGTDDFVKPLLPFLHNHDAFLLANHGVLTLGPDAWSAYYRMEIVEHAAAIEMSAGRLGSIRTLTPEQTEALLKQRKKWGVKKDLGPYPAEISSGNRKKSGKDIHE